MHFILQWIDVIWLPLAFVCVHKEQRLMAVASIFACMLMMRLETELMTYGGYERGILPVMNSYIFYRGLVVFSVFYMAYILISWFSPASKGYLFLATSLSLFFGATFVYAVVMIL